MSGIADDALLKLLSGIVSIASLGENVGMLLDDEGGDRNLRIALRDIRAAAGSAIETYNLRRRSTNRKKS